MSRGNPAVLRSFFDKNMLRKYRFEILFVLVVHLGFMGFQLTSQHFLLDDSSEYIAAADHLLHDGMLYCGDTTDPIDPALYTKRPPAYPLFLILTRAWTRSFVPLILLQMLLSMFSLLAMLKIFQPERRSRILVTLFTILYPAQFIYANLVMSEILFQFSLMMAALCLLRYIQTERIRILWLYQFMIILGIMTKPVLYPFILLNIVLFLFLYYRYRQRLVIISSLIPVVFVIIYAGINQQRTGYFHVSSIQQTNLIDYNLYYFLMKEEGEEFAQATLDSIRGNCNMESDFSKKASCLSEAATSYFRKDIIDYGVFHLKGMARYFIDPGRFDLYHFFNVEPTGGKGFLHHLNKGGISAALNYLMEQGITMILLLLLIAFFNLLRLIGFVLFLFNRRVDILFRLFLLFLAGYMAFATGPLGASRFMLPIVMLLSGAAAMQYGGWINQRLVKKRHETK